MSHEINTIYSKIQINLHRIDKQIEANRKEQKELRELLLRNQSSKKLQNKRAD